MRIENLNNTYHNQVIDFFGQDIVKFYFIIADLVRNNYSGDNFKVYGEFENNELKSILLNNFNNLTYYSNIDRSIDVYKDIIKGLKFKKISGPSNLVEKIMPYVKVKSDTLCYMGCVNNVTLNRRYPNLSVGFINTEEELGMQYDLLMSTDEYIGVLPLSKVEYINDQKNSTNINSRTAYLMVDNQMVSSCSTAAEYDKSAVVIGVVTNPKFRNQGYGSEVLISLFDNLLKEGKIPYLFYNNPTARSVYKRIGMEEVCQWRVVLVE